MFNESSVNDLYHSAVDAFPNTTKRQHVVDFVKIVDLSWTPFVGMRTLFIRGTAVNEGCTYKTMALFKNVIYGSGIPIKASDGRYFIEQLSSENNDVLVRCSCLDFAYRFNYYNFLDHSLWGRKRKKYEGQDLWKANPQEKEGICKHLMKMMLALKDSGIII